MTYPPPEGDSFSASDPNYSYGNHPYGGHHPYGAAQPYNANGSAPDNYSVWAIILTVVSVLSCSLISMALSIIAITNSNKVNDLWVQGRTSEATEAARQAKLMCMWSGGILIATWCLWGVLGFIYVAFIASVTATYGF